MQDKLPDVDLVTVNYNGRHFLENFFNCLNGLNYPPDKLRVFFVDNKSRDNSVDLVKKIKISFELKIIENKQNYGFAKANNMIFPFCRAKYIALLNNDTRVDKDWLIRLVEKMEAAPQIGIADSKRLPTQAPRYIDPVTLETSWCSGGSCLIRREALEKVGYFDENFFMYGEDNDLSWRMWLGGWKCVYVPKSMYEHHFGQPEQFRMRRTYFHVRNSILLRYVYGSTHSIRQAYIRYLKEALSLLIKKHSLKESWPLFCALAGHLPHIAYFIRKRRIQKGEKSKWIKI